MKNEYVENDQVNTAISAIYQAMYGQTDRGIKNGETSLTVVCPATFKPESFVEAIQRYFDGIYANPTLKKYYLSIDVQDQNLLINFKWGHHAIVANEKHISTHNSEIQQVNIPG